MTMTEKNNLERANLRFLNLLAQATHAFLALAGLFLRKLKHFPADILKTDMEPFRKLVETDIVRQVE